MTIMYQAHALTDGIVPQPSAERVTSSKITVCDVLSSTHRALVVAEIMGNICLFVREADVKWLAILARTCRALRAPAIEILWGRLKNLIPIFRLLPSDAWTFDVDTWTSSRIYRLERDLVAEDFTVIAKYAPLVKIIGFRRGGERCPRYESDFLPIGPTQIMTQCSPQPLLFPALHTLDWPHTLSTRLQGPHAGYKGFWACAGLYISPKLKKVVIDFSILSSHDDPKLSTFMTRIGAECPQITEVDIDVTTWGNDRPLPSTIEWSSSLVCRLARLQVLRCGNIPLRGTALAHLGCLSTLKEVRVLLTRDTVDSWTSTSLKSRDQARFMTLRKLDIRTQDLTAFNDLANGKFMFPQVETFRIDCSSFPSASEVDAFFNALQDLFSPSRLQSLSMETRPWEDQWRNNTILSCGGTLRRDHLRKLLAFHKVQTIILQAQLEVDLDDDIAEEMSAAWPQIETLIIPPQCKLWSEGEIKATLRSLQSFATNCPRLIHLNIPFRADGANIHLLPPRTPRNHALERLDLKWVLIDEHVSEVATLLGKILPNLKIDTNISGDYEQYNRWLAVKNELKSTLEGPTEDEADTPSEP
ncbi:predicted protein [Postia placenta Mad-698-R]|nr:predicted protein [Postia placenta Mad-698-R]